VRPGAAANFVTVCDGLAEFDRDDGPEEELALGGVQQRDGRLPSGL
jgi:hypothetical protein